MTRVTAGQAVVATLEQTGIRHAFTVPGESFLEILDALRDSSIRLVAVRHEAGAGFMAEAYAQLTGRPALCLVTRAVGAANISIALHTAMQNSTPLVVLAGQVPRPFRGREAFQEADLVASFGALCKAAAELDEPTTMAAGVGRLVEVAQTGRPGPVLIALPEDALEEAIEDARATSDPAAGRPPAGGLAATDVPAPPDSLVRDLLARLSNARRPVIVAGGGVLRSGAVAELQAFAEATGLGVIAAWRRPDVFPNDSPRYLGATGLAAARTVRARLREADVILALGTRLSEVASFEYTVPGPATELLHVDIAPGFGGARPAPALAVRADARAFLRAALAVLAGTGKSTRSGQSIRSARGRRTWRRWSSPTWDRGAPTSPSTRQRWWPPCDVIWRRAPSSRPTPATSPDGWPGICRCRPALASLVRRQAPWAMGCRPRSARRSRRGTRARRHGPWSPSRVTAASRC